LSPAPIPAPEPGSVAALAAAGFVSRSLAMAIDVFVIVTVVTGATLLAELVGLLLPKWVWLTTAIPAVVGAAASFVPLVYFVTAVAITGRTVGKAVMGIRVVGINGRRLPPARALVRTVAYLVSLVPLFAGFLWVLVDRERRGWHDHIARSRVVYEPDESVWPGTRSPARHPPVIGNSEVEENV
jgi:uncharacterized RDD family membrane protein YckC